MTEEQWGPWIEHDKQGCPVQDGVVVQIDCFNPDLGKRYRTNPLLIGSDYTREKWSEADRRAFGLRGVGIIRYRIRKPSALSMLQDIAAGVKQPEDVI